jgi:hypothetical protein
MPIDESRRCQRNGPMVPARGAEPFDHIRSAELRHEIRMAIAIATSRFRGGWDDNWQHTFEAQRAQIDVRGSDASRQFQERRDPPAFALEMEGFGGDYERSVGVGAAPL